MPEKRGIIIIGLVLILMITLPFLFAFRQNDADFEFGGFLINPVDGHSYLAKMEIGKQGGWIFNLPYTAETGEGAFLFLFYIFLGHVARLINADNVLVFHAARLIGSVLLIISVNRFYQGVFKIQKEQNMAVVITLFGSGLGWIAVLAGNITSDFWVAEAYPFLSTYTNPHFTIGLAIMAWLLTPDRELSLPISIIAGLILAIIQPFAVVIVVLVMAANVIRIAVRDNNHLLDKTNKPPGVGSLIGFGLGGGIYLIYQYLAIINDPLLAIWNGQNLTPSPAFFDLLLSFSPCLLLAAFGVYRAWKSESGSVLIIWGLICLVLLAVPWNLQRRFITGLFFPLAGLSIFGLKEITNKWPGKLLTGFIILMVIAVPTNLFVIFTGLQAAVNQDSAVYFNRTELDILDWLAVNADAGTLVAADPYFGLYIPSKTGLRVIYGHPFETINAEAEKEFLVDFFQAEHGLDFYNQEVRQRGIGLIIQEGEPGRTFAEWVSGEGIDQAYSSGEYTVFKIEE